MATAEQLAALMTFPKDMVFPRAKHAAVRCIGNGVCTVVAKAVFDAAAEVGGAEWEAPGAPREELYHQAIDGARRALDALRRLREAREEALRLARKRCSSEEQTKRVAECLMEEFKRSRAWSDGAA